MLVYHGSTLIIDKPIVNYSNRNLDFGIGFYVTRDKELAEKWSHRKKDIMSSEKSIVNVYELNEKYTECKYMLFEYTTKNWLDFVCDCRKGIERYKFYDVIEGPIADDKVFMAVDFYRKGVWDAERTISELKFINTSNQICFINQDILERYLKFENSYEAIV